MGLAHLQKEYIGACTSPDALKTLFFFFFCCFFGMSYISNGFEWRLYIAVPQSEIFSQHRNSNCLKEAPIGMSHVFKHLTLRPKQECDTV